MKEGRKDAMIIDRMRRRRRIARLVDCVEYLNR